MKALRPELADDEVPRARLRAEARSSGRLAHSGMPAAPLPAVPPPTSTRVLTPVGPQAAGLSGRPGQRWAVRATAVLLGLLAVALGLRETASEPGTSAPFPAPSRPAASSVPSDAGQHQADEADQAEEAQENAEEGGG